MALIFYITIFSTQLAIFIITYIIISTNQLLSNTIYLVTTSRYYYYLYMRVLLSCRKQSNRLILVLFRGQYQKQTPQRPSEQSADYRTLKIYYSQRSSQRSDQRGRLGATGSPGATNPIRTLFRTPGAARGRPRE